MATKMTITYICDQCGAEDTDKSNMYHYVVEASQSSAKKGPKRMEMDLCEDCAGDLDNNYVDVWRPEVKGGLTGVTVKVLPPKAAFEPVPITDGDHPTVCKKCGFVAKSWNGLLVHKKRKGH
jgi:hypothetical protein